MKEKVDIEFLHKNALWVIMDPWYPTPHSDDLIKYPHIDQHNEKTLNKIVDYIPNLKHVCISCPPIIIENYEPKTVKVHPKVCKMKNLYNSYSNIMNYMEKLQLNDIVYCGFHYGMCIVFKHDGAKNTSKKFRTWVMKDLCCMFPGEISEEESDKIVEKYSTII